MYVDAGAAAGGRSRCARGHSPCALRPENSPRARVRGAPAAAGPLHWPLLAASRRLRRGLPASCRSHGVLALCRRAAWRASRAADGSQERPGLGAEACTGQALRGDCWSGGLHQAALSAPLAGAQAAPPGRARRPDPGPQPVAARRCGLGRGSRARCRHLAGARAGPAAAAPGRRGLCRALAAGRRRVPAVQTSKCGRSRATKYGLCDDL